MEFERAVGNRALARIMSTGPGIQRKLTIGGAEVASTRIVKAGAYKTRLNNVITTEARAAGFTPEAVRRRLVEMTGTGAHVHGTKREAVVAALDQLRDAAWERLKRRPDVVYRTPPMTEADARRAVTNVERADANALQGLQQQGGVFAPKGAKAERKHEWGILKSRTRADECVLIVGERTGVEWAPFLNCGIAIAHSHPYFEQGPARLKARHFEQTGRVSTETKEIADHPIGGHPVDGAVLWNDLASRNEFSEMQKIFPSASDVAFAAKKRVTRHTVYTPYLVLNHPAGKTIANPDFNQGRMAQAPRLQFEIRDAAHVKDRDYGCELAAYEGTIEFWNNRVVTDGDGPLSRLKW